MIRTGTTSCGYCMTGDHNNCRPAIVYYGKTWTCECVHNEGDTK